MNGVFARNSTNDNFEFSIFGAFYSQIWPWEMPSCPSKSPCGFLLPKNRFLLVCQILMNFFSLGVQNASFFSKSKNAFWTPSEKKNPQNWTNKQTKIFWQQERTHTDFLMDKAFPMTRFGCKVSTKSKTQNCHLCYFLRIPRSYHAKYYAGGPNKGLLVIDDRKIAEIAISQKVRYQYFTKQKMSSRMVGHLFLF